MSALHRRRKSLGTIQGFLDLIRPTADFALVPDRPQRALSVSLLSCSSSPFLNL